MKTMDITDKGMGMLMRRAKKVPRGTVLFMHNGQLYMANAASMFDRASGGALFSRLAATTPDPPAYRKDRRCVMLAKRHGAALCSVNV